MSGHPAVRAVSPQAPMTDTWMGDDFFHQGAFRMSYGLEYSYSMETSKEGAEFDVGTYDMYDWYLRMGTLSRITDSLGRNLPTWQSFVAHPAYDGHWQAKAVQRVWTTTTVPTLTVGGWWDQEDIFGPQAIYRALEPNDKAGLNRIVMGPWNHGQWGRGTAEALGAIKFGSATGTYFRQEIQRPFFAFYLKDQGTMPLAEATVFEGGRRSLHELRLRPGEAGALPPPPDPADLLPLRLELGGLAGGGPAVRPQPSRCRQLGVRRSHGGRGHRGGRRGEALRRHHRVRRRLGGEAD
jgi:predicted acyl esterase